MEAVKVLLPVYVLLFLLFGLKDFKRFCLLTGIITIPFPTMYSLVHSPHKGWIDGIVINLSDISFILLYFYLLSKNKGVSNGSRRVLIPAFLFIFSIGLSLMNSEVIKMTLFQIIMIGKSLFLYYYVFANSLETESDIKFAVLALSISLLLESTYGCAQTVFNFHTDILRSDLFRPEIQLMPSGATRASGTIGYPNALARYIVSILLLNIALFLRMHSAKLLRMTLIIISLFALIFTGSRSAWISFALAIIVLLIYAIKRQWAKEKALIIFLFVMMITLVATYTVIHDRFTRSDHGAAASRIPLIKLAFNIIKENPIVGVGGNTYTNITHEYITQDLKGMFVTVVHNQYLLVFAECGLIGIFAYLWLMSGLVKESIACGRNKTSKFIQSLGVGVTSAFAAILVGMLFDMYKTNIAVNTVFILGGLCSAGKNIRIPDRDFKQLKA